MNEEFIRQFRKLPDSELVENIHARLERREQKQKIWKTVFLSMITMTVMVGALMTFSSRARADVVHVIEEIAGMEFDVSSAYPDDDEDAPTIEPEYLSLDDARSRSPFPIELPVYVPDGYERLADIEFYKPVDVALPWVEIIWKKWDGNKQVGRIDLIITPCSNNAPCGSRVGEGALEEITLNGKPAAVIRGAWNYDTRQYDLSFIVTIQWRYDENTVYRLSCWNGDMLDELIKMAESIP